MFRGRLWMTLPLGMPVVVWSHHVQKLLGYTAPSVPGSDLFGPVLGSVVFFSGGWPFLSGGWSELRARQPGTGAVGLLRRPRALLLPRRTGR